HLHAEAYGNAVLRAIDFCIITDCWDEIGPVPFVRRLFNVRGQRREPVKNFRHVVDILECYEVIGSGPSALGCHELGEVLADTRLDNADTDSSLFLELPD